MTDTSALPLDEKVVLLAADFGNAQLPFAFGGALALAYYAEPRATVDIDVNVFVSAGRADEVAALLGDMGVSPIPETFSADVARDGQVRVRWGTTPLDLFFSYDAFHVAAAERVVVVPFGDAPIPILAALDLMVCKAVFNRRKDWLDIEQMLLTTAGELDVQEVVHWVRRIVGDDDERVGKLIKVMREILGPGAVAVD